MEVSIQGKKTLEQSFYLPGIIPETDFEIFWNPFQAALSLLVVQIL